MTRVQAFIALFGDDPSKVTQTAVETIKDDLEIHDEESDQISDDVERNLKAFLRDPNLYISSKNIPNLTNLLRQLTKEDKTVQVEKKDEDNKPTLSVDPKPSVGSPVPLDLDFLSGFIKPKVVANPKPKVIEPKEKPDSDSDRPLYEPQTVVKKPTVVVPERKTTETKVQQWRHTPQTTALLHSRDWHEFRKRVEMDFSSGSDLADWITYMTRYEKGQCGFHKRPFGTFMLSLIEQLKNGVDPTSDQYKYMFIDENVFV